MKTSKKYERVNKKSRTKFLFEKIMNERHIYLKHRYLVENDKQEWRNILNTISDIGPIFHMDFSENLSGTPKFEPQSDHFSKQQFSLHCTVKYDCNIETEKPSYSYYYHLPDDSTRDAVFASTVVWDLLCKMDLNEM